MKRSISAKATISSNFDLISARLIPRIPPFRKMFSRPVSSGWKPVPTSSSAPTWPFSSATPSVGAVTRERTFSSVVLPAPLRPTTPSTSPCSTSSDTSRSAQNAVSGSGRVSSRWPRRNGRVMPSHSTSVRRPWSCSLVPILYCFDRPSIRMAGAVTTALDDVGERTLGPPEVAEPHRQEQRDCHDRHSDHRERGRFAADGRPPEEPDDADHRVERVDVAVRLGHECRRVGDRGREQPELHEQRYAGLHVPVLHVHGRQQDAYAEHGEDDEDPEQRDDQERR